MQNFNINICGLFNINMNFLLNLFSLIMTLSIILTQADYTTTFLYPKYEEDYYL